MGRHTKALSYSPHERLVFKLTGRWPQSVVERRLTALDLDKIEIHARVDRAIAEMLREDKP